MKNKLEEIRQRIIEELKKAGDSAAVRELEIKFTGRKGELTALLKSIAELGPEERKQIGQLANEVKNEIVTKFREAKDIIAGDLSGRTIDVGIPGAKMDKGHLSPVSQIQYELEDLFKSMGFMILDGPELEGDYYNFEGLNIPAHHPARDMQDTFYVASRTEAKEGEKGKEGGSKLVMRTHTSPMQVRAMQKYGAPLRCVVPGRVFRAEATDAVHEHTFDQMEGLMVGKGISLDNLIAVMKELLKGIFKKDMEVRIRPGYFPFVEPGIELDIKCTICHGAKCPACKHTGWLEILPAGMIHPNVLKHGGLDPAEYSGFAFGLGLTRLAMMRYGIGDIRLFNSGDLRFGRQF